jgi:A/G-specific adenine glycosylase
LPNTLTTPKTDAVAPRLLRWYDAHGRKDLPWQHPRSPYRVWLSEVMLQQTQVATVVPYFLRFVEKLPNLPALAEAPLDDVLALWSGLGYYSRARNLHRAARICVDQHNGELPRDFEALNALPGIGRSTAGAIFAQAHGLRFPILEGNVKRILARFHGIRGWPGSTSTQKELWKLAGFHTPAKRTTDYTQAIMDLGAAVCIYPRPLCDECPLSSDCVALREGLTAELPERKPTRKLPTRRTVMLMLRDEDGRILLQRRPQVGVWAGLWSLPEADDIAAAKRGVAGKHRIVEKAQPGDSFTHTFSHYHLEITPLTIRVAAISGVADDADQRWLSPSEAAQLGLPAPVRRLITRLDET